MIRPTTEAAAAARFSSWYRHKVAGDWFSVSHQSSQLPLSLSAREISAALSGSDPKPEPLVAQGWPLSVSQNARREAGHADGKMSQTGAIR